ncbi:MAG: LLM class flavin-dependent oxidoreductase [Bacillota bacterium]
MVYQGKHGTPTYDPWIALAAMAMRTERIRLGTLVTPLSRRRPWKVARESVTIDHLSGGRLVLGVGLGDGNDAAFTDFGETSDLRTRARMLDEALEVLAGLWSGRPFSFEGEFYRVKEITLLPPPLQRPRPPIWVGGIWPRKGAVRRAARWDGASFYKLPGETLSDEMTAEDVGALKASIQAFRKNDAPFDIVIGGNARRGDWEAERLLIRSAAEAGATWWVEWVPPGEPGAMLQCITCGPLRFDA